MGKLRKTCLSESRYTNTPISARKPINHNMESSGPSISVQFRCLPTLPSYRDFPDFSSRARAAPVPMYWPRVRVAQEPMCLPKVRAAQEPTCLPKVRAAQEPTCLPKVRAEQEPTCLLQTTGS